MGRRETTTERRIPARRGFLLLLAALLFAATLRGQQATPSTNALPTLTRVEQIRQLTREEAKRGYPVHLRAVVTYYNAQGPDLLAEETYAGPLGPDMFIQDSTAGVWVNAPAGGTKAKQGQLIEIKGVTEAPDFAPQVGKPRWKVIGQAPMPPAHRPTYERMASTGEDSQWVEIDGIVRSTEQRKGFIVLNVAMSGGPLKALIPDVHNEIADRLIDAEIRVRGACGALFNRKNQLIGVVLYVPNADEVQVTKPAPPDPFSIPVQPTSSPQQFTPRGAFGHRIHVQGVVTFQQPGSLLYISDGPVGLRVETQQRTLLRAGDRVDVLGFPILSGYRPVLEDAIFRLIASGPAPQPIPATGKQLLEGEYDSELVSIEANLLEKALFPGSRALILCNAGLTFDASLAGADPGGELDSLRAGSQLRVTGVCLTRKDENGRNQSFRILVDGSDDIVVINQPSWWTARHASQVLGWTGVTLLAAMSWVVVLRRKLRQQTEHIREQLKREAALEEQYRDLFENANDLIQSADAQGRLLYVNRAWRQTLGYTEEEVGALSVFDVVHPNCREHYAQFFRQVMAGENVEAVEVEFVTKCGEKVILEGTANCRIVDGQRVSTRGIFRNITARKRAEESLQRERSLLRTLIDNTPDYIYVKDAASRFLIANTALALRMGASSAEDLLGKTDRDFYPEELAAKFIHDEQEIMRSGEAVVNREGCVQDASGKMVWHLTTEIPFRDGEGKVVGLVGIGRNITQRKLAEAENQRLAAAIEQAAEAVVVTDLQGKIQYVNPAFTKVTGFHRDEALGQNPRILKSGRHDKEFYHGLWQTLLAGNAWRGEIVNRRKDGTIYDEEMTVTPVRDGSGVITSFIAVKQDVTARKQAEAQLQRAKKAAEAANRAKSEFVANMSHEIRTPMNGILGMTELALDTDLTAEQREYLGMVKTSADSLLTVINDILDFSKVEAGRLDLESIEFSLRQSLEPAVKALALRAHQKGLELNCYVHPPVPEVLVGDPGRLRQVLVNLVGNAVKFTGQGEVTVQVEKQAEEDGAVWLHFSVQDTGIGIAPEKQEAIFEPFTQADGSTARRYGGSGLGLTISHHLVEMLGGRMWVESALGQGSTFHFTARLGLGRPFPPISPAKQASLVNVPVLVVDDNATNRRILEDMLRNWRLRPTVVADGPAALDCLKKAEEAGRPFALMLTDVNMPDVDGFTLVEQVKQDPRLAGLTVLMLTSAGQRGDAARCRDLGVAAYLTKPVGQSELFDAIVRVLGSGSQLRPAALVTRHSLRETRKGLRVLLAEDNVVNQMLAVRLLEKRGCTVVVTADGREAVSAFEKEPFDLVLMDVQMPRMDGFKVTAAIREREKAAGGHTPIVAMTAHAMKGDREECLGAGMDDYLAKPIRAQELFEILTRLGQRTAVPEPLDV